MMRMLTAGVLVATLGISGCSYFDGFLRSGVDSAGREAGSSMGKAVGDSIGRSIASQYTAQFAALYAQIIFAYAFHSGTAGWITEEDYEVGQWTRWRAVGDGEENGSTMEKAFLLRTDDENEWWKVKFTNAGSGEVVILEGLFAPERARLLRLRGKFPEQPAGEIPVEEGAVYSRPSRLTEESLAGARVGETNVTVPAGTFRAEHYRYQDAVRGTTVEWFVSRKAPGGLVRYLATSRREAADGSEVGGLSQDQFEFQLDAYGDGAGSELGSF